MNILASVMAALSGILAAAVVCRAIQMRLFVEILAGFGCLLGIWATDKLSMGMHWPFLSAIAGYGGFVALAHILKAREQT